MKVVGFVGSPRRDGNTQAIVGEILKAAKNRGAETRLINLTDLDIKGCQGCYWCQDNAGCKLKDDMQKLYEEIRTASAVILGSPVYMWQMSGQTKIFVDRLLPFLNPDYSISKQKKKELVLVFTQGEKDPTVFMPYFSQTGEMFETLGFHVKEIIVANNMEEKGAAKKKEDLIKKARELGEELCK